MEMTKIESIWQSLESDSKSYSSLLYKRYSAQVKPDVFIALKSPEKLRCVSFQVSSSFLFDGSQWDRLKDIKIETVPDENNSKKKFLLVLLLNKQLKDIFSTLCEDLILGVAQVDSEQALFEKLLERIAKWQSLFEMAGRQGLSEESQRGIYGEVYFLRQFLHESADKYKCVKAWTGPERSIQDFQFSNWAVEVKTTHGNNHQKIHIASERQLDDSIVERIFLFHISLEVRNGHGETLNEVIDNVLNLLIDSTMALNLFKLKLIETGYFDVHKPFYEERGYSIRQENIYAVSEGFPRITERQIPIGVGDVKYSIVLSESEEWRINHESLFNEII
jgi:hypothetical protein